MNRSFFLWYSLYVVLLSGILLLGLTLRQEGLSLLFLASNKEAFPRESKIPSSSLPSKTMSFHEWLDLHKTRRRQGERKTDSDLYDDDSYYDYYSTPAEYAKRQRIYEANVQRWKSLNQIPGGARYGPETEMYADQTPEEFARLVGSCFRPSKSNNASKGKTASRSNNHSNSSPQRMSQRDFLRSANAKHTETNAHQSPRNDHQPLASAFTIMDVDWRAHAPPPQGVYANNNSSSSDSTSSTPIVSYVTPVKNQGPHGTCWSFAAAENLEGLAVRQGHDLQNVSEQEFISCCEDCQGRSAEHTFAWLLQATDGVPALEASYPYVGNASVPCLADTAPRAQAHLHSWGRVEDKNLTGEAIVEALQEHGPMGMGVDATCFHGYQAGIVRECHNPRAVNHAVLMVAAGSDLYYHGHNHNNGGNVENPTIHERRPISFPKSVDFFTIKNSWGPSWGEDGYVRIERGKNWWGPISVIYTK